MKHALIYLLLTCIGSFAYAQNNIKEDSTYLKCKKNTVYLELGGQGGIYSVGYDHINSIKPKRKNSLSVGLSYFRTEGNDEKMTIIALPLSQNVIYKNHVELGCGVTTAFIAEYDTYYTHYGQSNYTDVYTLFFLTPKIGLRYQKDNGGFFFRAALTPLINLLPANEFYRRVYPWAGISFGSTF